MLLPSRCLEKYRLITGRDTAGPWDTVPMRPVDSVSHTSNSLPREASTWPRLQPRSNRLGHTVGPGKVPAKSLLSSRARPPRGPERSPDNIGWDIPWGPEKVPPARCHMMGGTGGPRACSLRPRAAPALFPYHMCFAWSKFRCWSSLCRRSLTMYLPSMLSRRPYLGKRRVRTPLFTVA